MASKKKEPMTAKDNYIKRLIGLPAQTPSPICFCVQRDSLPGKSSHDTTIDHVHLVVMFGDVFPVEIFLICGGNMAEG